MPSGFDRTEIEDASYSPYAQGRLFACRILLVLFIA